MFLRALNMHWQHLRARRDALCVTLGLILAAAAGTVQAQSWKEPGSRASIATVAVLDWRTLDQANGMTFGRPMLCAVQLDLIVYWTRGPAGEVAQASGMILTPLQDSDPAAPRCPAVPQMDVVSYSHPTMTQRSYTLSNPFNPETQFLIATYASQGLMVVASDYLGYYLSNFPYHPYLVADSEAQVNIDALRAARITMAERALSIRTLTLIGYSQGGHAAMATHRALESRYRDEFPFAGSFPMSGPYALEKTLLDMIEAPPVYATINGGFAIIGMNRTYRNLYSEPKRVFHQPYAKNIEAYFPGPLTTEDLHANPDILPVDLKHLLMPPFVSAVRSNPNHPLRVDLRANSPLDWRPTLPMVLCGGHRDQEVPFYTNTVAAGNALGLSPDAVVDVDKLEKIPFETEQDKINYHRIAVYAACMLTARDAILDHLPH